MIIKVCGLKESANHLKVSDLGIDMIGINFYEPSPRYIGNNQLSCIPGQLRVGVFVNETENNILNECTKHNLDYVQLHGDESPGFTKNILTHCQVIKVFRIDEGFDWSVTHAFDFADYFLFDTKTSKYGGSGIKFNWAHIERYSGNVPFLLSGGIAPSDVQHVKKMNHPMFSGIDINSKFEREPGIKDETIIREFLDKIRN